MITERKTPIRIIRPHKGGRTARLPDGRITPVQLARLREALLREGLSYSDWIVKKLGLKLKSK